jgi:hypothetical protein
MSSIDFDVRTVPQRIAAWAKLKLVAVRQSTPAVLFIRAAAALAALSAMVLALPLNSVDGFRIVEAVVIVFLPAAAVGVLPRSRWVTLYAMAVVGVWVVSTVGFGEPAGLGRVTVLTASLYVMHRAATFAAVLPTDAVVATGVMGRWLRRTVATTAVGLAVGVSSLAGARMLPEAQSAVGPIVGSLVTVGLVALLVWLLTRRR